MEASREQSAGKKLERSQFVDVEYANGEMDEIPEQAFYMVGTIDEAVDAAAKMKAQG